MHKLQAHLKAWYFTALCFGMSVSFSGGIYAKFQTCWYMRGRSIMLNEYSIQQLNSGLRVANIFYCNICYKHYVRIILIFCQVM
jgi:hypothetical protein